MGELEAPVSGLSLGQSKKQALLEIEKLKLENEPAELEATRDKPRKQKERRLRDKVREETDGTVKRFYPTTSTGQPLLSLYLGLKWIHCSIILTP